MGVTHKGVKFKFAVNEKVLCYEPDPTKAKVLYESKVLDLVIGKDENNKKIPEYLIHFLRWNSSWDRCVREGLILPYTEENRQLQAKLLEDTAVKGKRKGKLPPKETLNKRLCSENVCETASESQKSEDKPDSNSSDDEVETEIHIDIPDVLKKQLEKDQWLITKNNKLVNIPCDPNIIQILEEFVIHLGSKLLYVSPPKNSRHGEQLMPEDVKRKLDTCKEVVDGIRIYFDFTLPYLLLYRQEMKQLQQQDFQLPNLNSVKSMDDNTKATPAVEDIPVMPSLNVPEPSSNDCSMKQLTSPRPGRPKGQPGARKVGRPRLVEARNGSSVKRAAERKTSAQISASTRSLRSSDDSLDPKKEPVKTDTTQPSTSSTVVPDPVVPMETRGAARKTLVPKSGGILLSSNEFFSTSGVGSSNSSAHSTVSDSKISCQSQLRKNTELLKELENWKLLPNLGNEKLPSMVYGAHHLLRLFVKLPDLLSKMKISKYKVEMLLDIIEHFLLYLIEKLDVLFSSSHYVDLDTLSPVKSTDVS